MIKDSINIRFKFDTIGEAKDFLQKAVSKTSIAEEQIDTDNLRADIYETLVDIHERTGSSKSFLEKRGYTTIDSIPNNELVSFLEYINNS